MYDSRPVYLKLRDIISASILDGDFKDGEILPSVRAVREQADQQAIRRAMARSDGNVSSAARMLGVSRPTLYDLLKSYNLQA